MRSDESRNFGFLFATGGIVAAGRPTLFARPPTHRTMAVTFDDLPFVAVAPDPYERNAERIATTILRVLKIHKAPAVAFVNEANLSAVPADNGRTPEWF